MKCVKTVIAVSAMLASHVVSAANLTAWPEALADSLTSDGTGYVDLGYRYHMSSFPKTSRIVCELYDNSWGSGRDPGPVLSTSFPRTIFGYQDSGSGCMSVARYSGSNAQVYYGGWVNTSKSCGRLDTVVSIDYVSNSAVWSYSEGSGKTLKFSGVTAPVKDATGSYYLFANNVHNGENLWQGIFAFKNLRVYEKAESGDENLARDYVPCINNGEYGVFDKVTHEIFKIQNESVGFNVANARWRLTVGDQVTFVSEVQSIDCPSGTDADGWMLVSDRDGSIIESGRGTKAAFTMPTSAATLLWAEDMELEPGATMDIAEALTIANLAFGESSALSFTPGAMLTVFGDIQFPELGMVNISAERFTASGVYPLIAIKGGAIDLANFKVVALADGLLGSFELRGEVLCLRITGKSAENAAKPDRILQSLRSDGTGYVDLGYRYHMSSFPKTSRIVCELYDNSWGTGRTPGPVLDTNAPRTIFGYQDSSSGSLSAVRYSGSNAHVYYGDYLTQSKGCGRFDTVVSIDYINNCASWSYSEGDGNTLEFANVTAPIKDATGPYYLFANNVYNGQNLWQSIFAFKNLRIYEKTESDNEVLARDYVPALKDGKPCVYDKKTGCISSVQNETVGFVATGASWPAEVFPEISQQFGNACSVSRLPVSVPAFSPETEYVFTADGTISLKRDIESLSIVSYSADGEVVNSELLANPEKGRNIEVKVGTAFRTVVRLSGVAASGISVKQDFPVASSASGEDVFFRNVSRNACEFMVSADCEFLFKTAIDWIYADSYDASGNLLESEKCSGRINVGGKLFVSSGTAAYKILRVELSHPRLRIIVR